MLLLAALYAQLARPCRWSAGALRGMGAVAAGLVLATALKLAPALRSNPLGLPACAAFGARSPASAVGVLRWPLVWVVLGLGLAGMRAGLVEAGAVSDRCCGARRPGCADWLALFGHFLLLSLLAIGGAITTAPDMHRFVVGERGWLTDAQFTASVALAQAAPGPERAVRRRDRLERRPAWPACWPRWLGILLPSTTLALAATRWGERAPASRAACAPSPPAWRR